jgi:hypothetical protein
MNRERYDELTARVLDDELPSPEAEELAAVLRSQPELQRDFRRQLVLWEVWSQAVAPERSTEAFVAAWQTRLAAEAGTGTFADHVHARLERQSSLLVRASAVLTSAWSVLRRPAGLAFTAAVAAVVTFVIWLALPHSAQAMITIRGEAVCPACVLHEGHQHVPAVRVREGGKTLIYYLERSPSLTGLQGSFCSGPTPVTVEGKPHTAGGRVLLNVSHIELAPSPQKPVGDQRILFPL